VRAHLVVVFCEYSQEHWRRRRRADFELSTAYAGISLTACS